MVAMAALFLWQASVALEKYQSKITSLQVRDMCSNKLTVVSVFSKKKRIPILKNQHSWASLLEK